MSRPKIALNGYYQTDRTEAGPIDRDRVGQYAGYFKMVAEAGGLPFMIPPLGEESDPEILSEYLELADGFLFTGALLDYPPAEYGESTHPKTLPMGLERLRADRALMRRVIDDERRRPALGICAGLQLLNIEAGGGLDQDSETDLRHIRLSPHRDAEHEVEVFPDTLLASIFSPGKLKVNSSHHQAANPEKLGKNLRVNARASDGTIEGLELEGDSERFFLFVQWHPERILDVPHRDKLFKAFVEACKAPVR